MKNKIALTSACLFFWVCMVFSLQSCAPTRAGSIKKWEKHEWKAVKTDKKDPTTRVIYTRKIAGTSFLEYKIEGQIEASPKACLAAFKQELYMQAANIQNKKYPTYDIVDESEQSLSTYVIHKEPFPLKNTEMSVKYSFFHDEAGNTGVRWKEAWNECTIQASKKLNRVETFRGSWNFSPISKDSSQAMNSVQFDPKRMPLVLVEPMVFNFLKKGLENLREKTSESREVPTLSK